MEAYQDTLDGDWLDLKVYSHTHGKWLAARVVKLQKENKVSVEYEVENVNYGKSMCIQSKDLDEVSPMLKFLLELFNHC